MRSSVVDSSSFSVSKLSCKLSKFWEIGAVDISVSSISTLFLSSSTSFWLFEILSSTWEILYMFEFVIEAQDKIVSESLYKFFFFKIKMLKLQWNYKDIESRGEYIFLKSDKDKKKKVFPSLHTLKSNWRAIGLWSALKKATISS